MQSARRPLVSYILLSFVLMSALMFSSCDGFFVGGGALNSITVTPTSIFLKVGESKQFSASGTTVDGTTKDVTNSVNWTSSAASATVNAAGMVAAVSTGNATVTAAQDGVSATGSVIVNSQALQSLAITPSSPTVATGSTTQLTATATFADNSTKDLTNQVAWSSGTTSVATVNSTGQITGVAAGTSVITVTVNTTSGTVTGTTTLTVQ
jgi:uncharacterized protein YjdB